MWCGICLNILRSRKQRKQWWQHQLAIVTILGTDFNLHFHSVGLVAGSRAKSCFVCTSPSSGNCGKGFDTDRNPSNECDAGVKNCKYLKCNDHYYHHHWRAERQSGFSPPIYCGHRWNPTAIHYAMRCFVFEWSSRSSIWIFWTFHFDLHSQ